MATDRPARRVALIHAVTPAIAPVQAAFRRLWPEAEPVNILDESLSPDRARDGRLTEAMAARIGALADYAMLVGADAVLYTCSAFGPAIEAVAQRLPVPVLKPNEAMFETALQHGRRIGMIATFAPSVATMEEEFRDARACSGADATLATILVDGALDALKGGDAATHDRLVAARAAELGDCDAIMLAHFSTSRAADAVRARVACPVLTSPDAAVAKLMRLMPEDATASVR